jgi:hypothetical protein
MALTNDENQENYCQIVLKISSSLKRLSEISKLRHNISELNELFEQRVENLCKFVDKSEINVQNKNNLSSSKIVIENSIELNGRKINQNIENDMKNKLFKCVWPQCRYICKRKGLIRRHILCHSEERFKRKAIICKSSLKHQNSF